MFTDERVRRFVAAPSRRNFLADQLESLFMHRLCLGTKDDPRLGFGVRAKKPTSRKARVAYACPGKAKDPMTRVEGAPSNRQAQ